MSNEIEIAKDTLTIDGSIEFRISHDPNTGKTAFGHTGGDEVQLVALSIIKSMLNKTIESDNLNRKNKKYSRSKKDRETVTAAYKLIDDTMQAILPNIIKINTERASEEEKKSNKIIMLK